MKKQPPTIPVAPPVASLVAPPMASLVAPSTRKWKRFVDTPAVSRSSINTETLSSEGKTQRLKRASI